MNKEERQALIDELWTRDDPQVMIIRYDPANRIGTQDETVTFHQNPMQTIDAFYRLFTGPHDFLKNGHYLINWLNAHLNPEEPEPQDLVDEVMSDLTQDRTVYHEIIYITIIPYEDWHTTDHGTLAERLEREHGDLLDVNKSVLNSDPDQELPDEEMIDLDDVVMFDHDVPPPSVPEHSFLDDEARAQLLPFETEPYEPLFATPTPGPVPLPSANAAAAPPLPANNPRVREIRDTTLGDLNSRRRFPCTFAGCNKRFTRQSDLRRHWLTIHPGHAQQ